jgi:hypothetical protein
MADEAHRHQPTVKPLRGDAPVVWDAPSVRPQFERMTQVRPHLIRYGVCSTIAAPTLGWETTP